MAGNEKADIAAKMATGWRKKKKRNGKFVEVDTRFTAPPVSIPQLRSACNQVISQVAQKEWEAEWREEEKGKDLRRLAPEPSKSVLRIHGGVQKVFSALITQMRTSKIGLKHFLHSRRVPWFDSGRCDCRRDLHTVRHVLQEYRLHHRLRRETWREIERKEPAGSVEVNKMLTNAKYARKAALFIRKTVLLGQFADLPQSLTK